MTNFFFWVLVVAAFSHLWNGPLQEPEQILSWKPQFIRRLLSFGKAKPLKQYPFNVFQTSVIIVFSVCPKCFSFWLSIIIFPLLFELEISQYFAFVTLSVYTTFVFSEQFFKA